MPDLRRTDDASKVGDVFASILTIDRMNVFLSQLLYDCANSRCFQASSAETVHNDRAAQEKKANVKDAGSASWKVYSTAVSELIVSREPGAVCLLTPYVQGCRHKLLPRVKAKIAILVWTEIEVAGLQG